MSLLSEENKVVREKLCALWADFQKAQAGAIYSLCNYLEEVKEDGDDEIINEIDFLYQMVLTDISSRFEFTEIKALYNGKTITGLDFKDRKSGGLAYAETSRERYALQTITRDWQEMIHYENPSESAVRNRLQGMTRLTKVFGEDELHNDILFLIKVLITMEFMAT